MILFVVKPTPTAQREASWDFSSYLEGVWVEIGLTLIWEEGGRAWTNGRAAVKFCRSRLPQRRPSPGETSFSSEESCTLRSAWRRGSLNKGQKSESHVQRERSLCISGAVYFSLNH